MEARLGWRRRLLFSAVLVGVAVLSVELPLQLYYRFTAGDWLFRRTLPPIYEADPTRCYRVTADLDYVHRTNEFTIHLYTNAQSFRTDARREPVAFEKPEDVYRVLFLGPSFTFGWGSDHEETYAARIASALRVPGKRVELLNLGTPAQSSAQQLCWLAHEGHRYDVDLVVQTSYGHFVDAPPTGCVEPLVCPYVADSQLYFTPPNARDRAIALVKNLGTVFYGYYVYSAFSRGEPKPGVGTGKELYGPGKGGDDLDLPGLVASYQRFAAYVHSLVGPQTPLAIIHLPLSFMVHPGDRSRWKHIVDVEPEAAIARTRQEIAALRAGGLHVIDTLDGLIAQGGSARQYFWLDIHLTPAGNATVAQIALPELQGLVTDAPGGSPRTLAAGANPDSAAEQLQ